MVKQYKGVLIAQVYQGSKAILNQNLKKSGKNTINTADKYSMN
jgi:hypothetical protein